MRKGFSLGKMGFLIWMENEMKKIAFILEMKHDMCVLQCVYNEDKLKLSEDEIIDLNAAH